MSTATLAPAVDEPVADVDYWEDEDCDLRDDTGEQLLDRVSGAIDRARSDTNAIFDLLADDLESAMLVAGSTRRLMRHSAYTEILAMGEDAIPLLLERLGRPGARPLWLRLLGSLTTFQPGAGQSTVPEAAAAWITWGKLGGHTRASR
jgi:hypothetical protein